MNDITFAYDQVLFQRLWRGRPRLMKGIAACAQNLSAVLDVLLRETHGKVVGDRQHWLVAEQKRASMLRP